jgi:hypothetical protein
LPHLQKLVLVKILIPRMCGFQFSRSEGGPGIDISHTHTHTHTCTHTMPMLRIHDEKCGLGATGSTDCWEACWGNSLLGERRHSDIHIHVHTHPCTRTRTRKGKQEEGSQVAQETLSLKQDSEGRGRHMEEAP